MKSRTRTIIELVIILVMVVWIAFMVQWNYRHPGERLGPGAEQIDERVFAKGVIAVEKPE